MVKKGNLYVSAKDFKIMEKEKRRTPRFLRKILEYDVALTQKFVLWANQYLPFRSLRIHYKVLEISCHGIPWFACWLAFMWMYTNESLVQMQINMLLGLIIDIVLIAVTKAYVRRKRPVANSDDMLGQMGPDKFSFPSGHASRAVYIVYFFIYLYPLSMFLYPPLLAWAFSICMSRLLLNRHHLSDVIVGILYGLFNGLLLEYLWLDKSFATWIWISLTDDKLEGGEYHV